MAFERRKWVRCSGACAWFAAAARGFGRVYGQGLEVGFDRGVARRDQTLTRVEEFEVLLQDEEVLGAVVPGEGGDDLGLGGLAAVVAMPGEPSWVGLSGDDVAEDPQTGDAGDVTDDDVQLKVHLHERFLHALDVGSRVWMRVSR